jgi:hypothetical protein
VNDDDDDFWEDEARSEAQQEAAAEEHFEEQARQWVRDNPAEFAREFFDENYGEAVKVFTSERLQSYYVEHPASAVPALETLNYARTLMPTHPRAALVFGATSTELVIKNLLLRPLISGLVHMEELALFVVEQSINQTGVDRFQKLLAGIVSEFSSFDLSALKRPSSSQTLWEEIKKVQEVRNGVIHRGETADEEMATRSIEVADTLLNVIFPAVLSRLHLHTHAPITICNEAHDKTPS